MAEEKYPCTPVGLDWLDTHKYVFTAEQEISATPEEIFACFEDAEAWTVWAGAIQKVDWTSPKPFGVGTTRTVYMMGGLNGYEEFIAWERGKRMAFCFVEASKPMIESFAEDYIVEDLGNGKTKVTWRMGMANKGISNLFMPITAPVMRFALKKMLKDFRKHVEAEWAGKAAQAS